MTLAGYRVALDGCPSWAIANAVRRFLQGKVPEQSRIYCPRPPELRAAVDVEMGPILRQIEYDRRRGRMQEEAAQFASKPPRSESEKARAAEIYAQFCRNHAQTASSSRRQETQVFLDPAKLAELPDAPTTWERVGWLNRGGRNG